MTVFLREKTADKNDKYAKERKKTENTPKKSENLCNLFSIEGL